MNPCFPIFSGLDACRHRLREINAGKELSYLHDQEETVRAIIEAVRAEGDAALLRFTREFDTVDLTRDRLRVSQDEVAAARHRVDNAFVTAVEEAKQRVESYHRKQLPVSWLDYAPDGIALGQKVTPMDRVGVYVPGGKANYPSTVLMTSVPAKVAGVRQVALVCPPGHEGEISPHVLVAADVAGVDEIYRVGGAQAVAALALGTDTIPRVDKIVGPGNIYVVLAKKLLFGTVGIESLPGPSEVAILSDGTGRPEWIAADLMAQSEHGPDSCSLLITTSLQQAESVVAAVDAALDRAPRAEHIRESFRQFGGALVVGSLEEAMRLLNEAASEHVQVLLANPWEHLDRVRNAGAIFVGEYSTVPLGDYLVGPSHVLPTATTARFSSGLSVDDFVKKSSLISVSRRGAENLADHLKTLTNAENLPEHYQALQVRLKDK
ncbi:MAG: histidinol dehydrogenase [Armatimonadetes bacterium]|nr:histidinol dehydrogenase [Armatimonadota bacterium]PIU64308.1 MAG: histidinol dehydrogenase [Armatimonadetes bacterium CG07_land_8_20_14_0_80_59_28]PIX40805.1 MAG: histidinol dehydrogenase [Armatimonadetes bacterium CG_4_8_14_3_um_filter_58_9]PIY44780.1 MAG: histidinol dehydrogenase [Armatimonadetes bacterium CG_4_10_14_3_um_filter_59_10]